MIRPSRQAVVLSLRSHLRALAFYPSSAPPQSLASNLLLPTSHLPPLLLHLLALTLVCRLAHWPLWLAPLLLAAFGLPQLLLRRWRIESLAPLITVYSLAALRLFTLYGLHQSVPPALDYAGALFISAVWAGLIWLRALNRLRHAWTMLAVGTAALMSYVVWLNRPAGVTGSDPFAYVQMGLDLAQHSTPLHRFPLAPFAASLGLPTLPTTHVGYVLPNDQGLAPTVWPPGYSVLLAIAYRLGGEVGMLSLNLWLGGLSLILTAALTLLICPPRWRRLSLPVGMGAAIVAATSFQQFTALTVPMADAAAQLFTALAVALTLYALRFTDERAILILGTLTGLTLAAAYSVRYTQVLVGPGMVLSAWFGLRDRKRRYTFLVAFALAALIGAAPDVIQRTQLYGAPWRFGSGELALFSFGALPEALRRLRAEFFSSLEFGWLWPLLIVGVIYLWRRHRFALFGLLLIYGSLITFHVWYPFVKLRDLLSLFPPLAVLSAVGGAVIILTLWRRGTAARLLVVVGLFALIALRLSALWGLREGGFFTFGYLYPEQRRSFDALAALTEPDAVIACSLNSGAVELYGRRATVRPGNQLQPGISWGTEHWLTFVAALRDQRRPLYLLMDSPEMDDPLTALRDRYTLTRVADLDVPVYYVGGGSRNLTVPLYRVDW